MLFLNTDTDFVSETGKTRKYNYRSQNTCVTNYRIQHEVNNDGH